MVRKLINLLAFKYLTPKLRIDETHLTPTMLLSKSFHLICTPTRCINLVSRILEARRCLPPIPGSDKPPLFIWEPVPDSCEASQLSNVYEALKFVDVISPNHQELGALFTESTTSTAISSATSSAMYDEEVIRSQCKDLLSKGLEMDKEGAVIVRCGENGCLVYTHETSRVFPAYYPIPSHNSPSNRSSTSSTSSTDKVLDTTGAGNA